MRSWYVVHRRSMLLLPVHRQLCDFLIKEGRSIIDAINGVPTDAPKAAWISTEPAP
jgi:hypothetical protein